jgi:putative membrane protein insertion efficiency factor
MLALSRSLVVAIHKLYKLCISPFFGNACRFNLSCSDYAREAILRHGWFRGGFLAVKRVCRCHPWHPGGDDPVPR